MTNTEPGTITICGDDSLRIDAGGVRFFITKEEDFSRQKIIYPDIIRKPRNQNELTKYPYMFLDEEGFFVEATNFLMIGESLKLILAVLASKLGVYAYTKFYSGPKFDDKGFRYKKAYLETFPIPKIEVYNSESKQLFDEIEYFVENLLKLHKSNAKKEEIYALDQKIDGLIYSLYGFKKIEIDYIEHQSN